MAIVKYPFHVKHKGVTYNPGDLITVDNPDDHVRRGAVLVEADVKKPTKRRKAKEETTPDE